MITCTGSTIAKVQPYEIIHGNVVGYLPEFMQKMTPNAFFEVVMAALDIPREKYQLGLTKLFMKAGTGKADVMLGDGAQALQPGEQGVFVDDDIREHADARLRQCESMHRVLFTRS